ncbi:MAG: trigger factor [Candidatus Omnitrophica bacterium]|nr:trigger factor [Candidatus Omnitrophota bacterium]
MRSNLKKGAGCKARMTVEVEAQKVEGRFQEIFRGIQRVARLPGFRGGKAPFDLVEKKFSKEAEEEVLKSLIPEAYHQSVEKQKVDPVSLPSISEIKMNRGKALTFTAEFELKPEFSLRGYKGVRLKRQPVEVTEEEVEKGLTTLLDSRADLVPLVDPRPVQRGDFIVADLEIWKDGQYAPAKQGVLLAVEPAGEDDFFEKIVGAQTDEVREVFLDKKPHYKVWVRQIKEKKTPPLDEEFAKGFGKETVAELREAVRKDLVAYKRSESFAKMRAELFSKLLAMASFEIPAGLVEKQKERLLAEGRREWQQKGLTKDRMESQREAMDRQAAQRAVEQVKLYFILQKIASSEEIEADEVELEKKLSALAAESKRPMEEVRHLFEGDLRESMRESKTVDFLVANAKLDEKDTV